MLVRGKVAHLLTILYRATVLVTWAALLVVQTTTATFAQLAFYVDDTGGSDGNPGTSASLPWKTIARVNKEYLHPGDEVLFKRGGVWREWLRITHSGTPGKPIYYGAYGSGTNPVVDGSTLMLAWARHAGSIWKTAARPGKDESIAQVFFDGARGIRVASLSELSQQLRWYLAGDTLFVFSASDPRVTYQRPGVEVSLRLGISTTVSGAENFVIDGLDVTKTNTGGIHLNQDGTGILIKNVTSSYNFGSGIYFVTSGTTVQDCRVHHNGEEWHSHGIYAKRGDGFRIENCRADSNAGAGIQTGGGGAGVITRNSTRGNGSSFKGMANGWGICHFGGTLGKRVEISFNVVHENQYHGLQVDELAAGDTVFVANNVVYDNGTVGIGGGLYFGSNDPASRVISKNNISFRNRWVDLYVSQLSGAYEFDHNVYYRDSGDLIRIGPTTYKFADFVSRTGRDAHSISQDPKVRDAVAGNFALRPESPCINSGAETIGNRDLLGTLVPQGPKPDRGAVEYPVPGAASVVYPTNGSTDVATIVDVRWAEALNAQRYRCQLSTDPSFSTLLLDSTTTQLTVRIGSLEPATKHYVRVCGVNVAGTGPYGQTVWFITSTTKTGVDSSGQVGPTYKLNQNYPNPFNPSTAISFSLEYPGDTSLRVFSTDGRQVATLHQGYLEAGAHIYTWDARGFSSGVYLCRLESQGYAATRKMTLIK